MSVALLSPRASDSGSITWLDPQGHGELVVGLLGSRAVTQIRRLRAARAVIATLALVAMCGMPGQAALPLLDKVDSSLRSILDNPLGGLSKVRVIVSAKPGQLASLVLTLRLSGFKVVGEHELIEAVTIEAPRLAVATLTTLGLVRAMSLDAPLIAFADTTTTGERLRGTIGLAETPYTGAGVGVAVVDWGSIRPRRCSRALPRSTISPPPAKPSRSRRTTTTGMARTSPASSAAAARRPTAPTPEWRRACA